MIQTLPVRQPNGKATPVTQLMVYLTEECNLRCSYCFVHKKPRPMSRDTALKTLHFFLRDDVSAGADKLYINFFGGEPFLQLDLMEDLWQEWQRLQDQHPGRTLRFSATTNGTIVNGRAQNLIRQTDMLLLVSLDGDAQANRHRPFVSGRDSYPVLARNLPRLLECCPNLTVRLTYHPESCDLVGSVEHALSLGARWIMLGPVVEADWRGHEDRVEESFQRLADWFLANFDNGRAEALYLTWGALKEWHTLGTRGLRPDRPCPVGDSLLAVDPDGHVMPCHRFLYRPKQWLGSVDQPQLGAERDPYLHLGSDQILGCDGCVARPICGGGCRVVSLQSGGGLHGTHPFHCLLTRAHARAVARIYSQLSSHPAFQQILADWGPPGDHALLRGDF